MWHTIAEAAILTAAAWCLAYALRWRDRAARWKHHFEHVGKQLAMSDAALARVDHENQVLRTRLDSALNRLYGTAPKAPYGVLHLSPNVTAGVVPPRRHVHEWPPVEGQSMPRVPPAVGLAQSGGAAHADETRQWTHDGSRFSEALQRPRADPAVILPPAGPVPVVQPPLDDDPLPRGP